MNSPPVQIWPGAALFQGDALRILSSALQIAADQRSLLGLSRRELDILGDSVDRAMAARGQDRAPGTARLLSVAETAQRLNISERHIRRRATELGGQNVGGQWIFTEAAVREHLEGSTHD